MNRIFTLCLFLFAFAGMAFSQQPSTAKITFRMYSPTIDDSTQVYISGNKEALGDWSPAKIKLKNVGNKRWEYVHEFTIGEQLEYKYTQGTWDIEPAQISGFPLLNSLLTVKKDTIVETEVVFWTSSSVNFIKGQITGRVAYHTNIGGKNILPRDIIVWLPPKYNKKKATKFPVLYMHDGQNLIDPNTSIYRAEWGIDETATKYISSNELNSFIIVGIYNSPERTKEYTDTELGQDYQQFVVSVLKPFIDKTYLTLPDAANTIVGGASAGGTVSFLLAWNYPTVFSKAICMSPAFKIDNIDCVSNVLEYNGEKKPIQLYIDNGGMGLEQELQPGIDEMLAALKQKGYTDVVWKKFPNDLHSEISWSKRVKYPLFHFLGKTKK